MAYIKSSFGNNIIGILGNSGDYIAMSTGLTPGIYNGSSTTQTNGFIVWNVSDYTNIRTTVDIVMQGSTDGVTFSSVTFRGSTNDITSYKYLMARTESTVTFTLS